MRSLKANSACLPVCLHSVCKPRQGLHLFPLGYAVPSVKTGVLRQLFEQLVKVLKP